MTSLTVSASQQAKTKKAVTKLRKLIKRKTSEKRRLLADIAAAQTALAPLVVVEEQIAAHDEQIHALFVRILERTNLPERQREVVNDIYESLQFNGTISWRLDDESETGADDAVCDCPLCVAARRDEQCTRGHQPADNGARWQRMNERAPFEEEWAHGPEPPPATHLPTAPKLQSGDKLRRLYRRLAMAFHPDRTADDVHRTKHERIMREVNDAYHSGDADRLLELSAELGVAVDDLRSSDGVIRELCDQYERIKHEVRILRRSPPGELVIDMRRAQRNGSPSPITQLNWALEDNLMSSTSLRDTVKAFADGAVNFKCFMSNFAPADDANLLEMLFDAFSSVPSRPQQPTASTRKRKARKAQRKARRKTRRRR